MAKKTMEHPAEFPAEQPAAAKRFKVIVPNRDFKGQRGGVTFTEGVGHTSDPAAAQWCRERGYLVREETGQ